MLADCYFFLFDCSINVANESFSTISSSNPDSVGFPVISGDNTHSLAPNSESGTTPILDAADSNCPGSVSITECSLGVMYNSSSSTLKK
jgi:hypothetical protein